MGRQDGSSHRVLLRHVPAGRLHDQLELVRPKQRIITQLEGKPGALNLVVVDEQRLAVQLEGVEAAPRTLTTPPQPPAEVVGRQLSDRGRDPVFRESMAVAQVLARSLLR